MKHSNRFKHIWFVNIFDLIKAEKVGHTAQLTDQQLRALLELHGLQIPPEESFDAVLEGLRYRLREQRRELMPVAKTDTEYKELRLEDCHQAVIACFKENSLTQIISAVRLQFLRWLKDTARGGDANTGLNNLKDPWKLKISWLEPEEINEFEVWAREKGIDSSSISRVRALSKFLFENSSNPTRRRNSKHCLYSPEIEAILEEFGKSGVGRGETRTVCTMTRKILKTAQIKSADELLKPSIFQKVVETQRLGITDAELSRAKVFFRWLGQKYSMEVPKFFENRSRPRVFQLSREDKEWYQGEIATVLKADGYRKKSLLRPLGLLRIVMAANDLTAAEEIKNLPPSAFVKTAIWAADGKWNLGTLLGIKAFSDALTALAPQSKKWTESRSENFRTFEKNVLKHLSGRENPPYSHVNIQKFKSAFKGPICSWPAFFEELAPQFYAFTRWDYRARSFVEGKPRAKRKDRISGEVYKMIYSHMLDVAYGPVCGNKKDGALKRIDGKFRQGGLLSLNPSQMTTDQTREFEYETVFDLQASGGFRFYSEVGQILYFDKRPLELTPDTPACIFPVTISDPYFQQKEKKEEKEILMVFQNSERKNELPYMVPLNTVCEDMIRRYIHVFGIKSGEKLLTLSVGTLADNIKAKMCALFGFGKYSTVEKILAGEARNEAMTTHCCRPVLETLVEVHYHGSERPELQAVLLGHKLDRSQGATTTEQYTAFINTCERHASLIRRIKDLELRTDEELRHDRLMRLEKTHHSEDRKGHKKTQEGVRQIAEMQATQMISQMLRSEGGWQKVLELKKEADAGRLEASIRDVTPTGTDGE